MPPPSLVSLLPTASISPRSRRTKLKAPTASHHYLLCSRRAAAPSPLHASPSYSSSPATSGGGGGSGGEEQLHLLEKPSATVPEEDAEAEAEPEPAPAPLSTEEALAPFLKFFQAKSTDPDADEDADAASAGRRADSEAAEEGARRDGVSPGGRRVRYYDPKPGDLVAGVVVRSDGRTLDVDVGAGGEPALLLAKEIVPVSEEEFGYLACDVASEHAAEFATEGRVGVMVRQIKQLNVPIKIKILEWNAGGLLSRIEGLRAFLPKPEMMTRAKKFTDLKNKVGQQMHVCITRIDEGTNELIISEKEAWAVTYLSEGTLLQGTVRKLFTYGAQIRIGETNRGGLLHISKTTHGQLRSISDVLKLGERVKALVIKPTAPDRIALSIKDLESEPGLFITNKEKVFSEAEEMAKRYREQIAETTQSAEAEDFCDDAVPFDNEVQSYANWKWMKFSMSDEAFL